ncbi:hypothetical protein [Tortoise microvirus 104]|nr:hypothetical protein [Tortoise microvirus 6]QCS37457.1 hypothetical protein [Tortoise microvirus 104]
MTYIMHEHKQGKKNCMIEFENGTKLVVSKATMRHFIETEKLQIEKVTSRRGYKKSTYISPEDIRYVR